MEGLERVIKIQGWLISIYSFFQKDSWLYLILLIIKKFRFTLIVILYWYLCLFISTSFLKYFFFVKILLILSSLFKMHGYNLVLFYCIAKINLPLFTFVSHPLFIVFLNIHVELLVGLKFNSIFITWYIEQGVVNNHFHLS